MREIKFRAWYIPREEMLQPDRLESINFETKVLGVYMPIENKGFHKLRMSDFILMQFTGLKDRNGKDIYEGDILRVPDLYETPENTSTMYHNELVGFERCAFTLGGQPLTDDAEYVSDECEVIGNVWEDGDLLNDSQVPKVD